MSLVNMTFDWLKKEWADEVDFVVWTGDNARSVRRSASMAAFPTPVALGDCERTGLRPLCSSNLQPLADGQT